ncbi:Yos1-like protein [Tilletiaria anomala UBC 951]|uniref:Yos1-like protein n=1 Tax=Tilletiaria anomala (strain ATCC 24038 / CBS 436.72 / UBC 951) TaxID=1037660 RepID=A0A066VAL3_TILAU|nr:Yos1-like protein [Tilletiaria anomala UBC 951]KDN37318.1 Yos1-like protein [Tilletiaria anomala UBC 951]
MVLGLGGIVYAGLLLVNAIAILNEERFLARVGWSANQVQGFDQGYGHPQDASIKARLISLISAVRMLLRIPLIVVNTVVIIYELILG